MRNFIVNEYQRIEDDKNLSERDKNNSRREVLEKAITKLEILKSKRSASDLIKELEAKLSEGPAKGDDRLLCRKDVHPRSSRAGQIEEKIPSYCVVEKTA
jgi:hypothetical protein